MPRTDASNVEQKLLRNRNPNVALGPFDGRVAAIHPSFPELYISTPNCEYIPLPPGPRCNVYPRFDGRFGPDDHTQWPQPFSEKFPHLSCIPKKTEGHTHSVIWWDPVEDDFKQLRHDGEDINFGKWSEWRLQSLGASSKWLLDEVTRRRTNSKALDSHPEIVPLSVNLERALSRLRSVPMSYRGATISLRLVQRLWLELHGLMEYVDRYLPFMDGRTPPAEQLADVIGSFVLTAHSAERLFAAGIPYWTIRQLQAFDAENILSIDTIVKPDYLLVVDDHAGYAPRIYQGDSNNNRYLAICNFSLKYIHYANPFAGELRTGISPYEFSQTKSLTGPSRVGPSRMHAGSVRPYTKPSSEKQRDKYRLVNSPYMPSCLDSWIYALETVDRRPERLYSAKKLSDNDGRYAFPEPGIFCSGDKPDRRNKFLAVWEILYPIVINRMSSDMGSINLLSNEQWRILLAGRQPNDKTRRGSMRISITDLLTPDAAAVGIDLSQTHEVPVREYSIREAQEKLWELSELSFRFDLIMLDCKAFSARELRWQLANDEYKPQAWSPLIREPLIMACFPFGPSDPRHLAFVHVDHARRGLASPAIQDRLRYLTALRAVMGEWDGFEIHDLGRLQIPTEDAPENEMRHYERVTACFYTQSYFRFFGRAAIIPMYLEQ